MKLASDGYLLGRYVKDADHDAFSQLVHRHLGFVYALARRQTRDAHLAEDVAQAVMIVLARKAGTIRSESVLTSWLFAVTRHAARNALKLHARQRFHERHAARLRTELLDARDDEQSLHDVLDEAIARLPELDRSGVLLHYYDGRTHDDVAATLGLSAHASRKRVARALRKMRTFLAGRGVAVSATALFAELTEQARSAAVPAGLVESSVNVAMLSCGTSICAQGGSMVIAQGVTRMLTLAKLKIAAMIALAAGGVAAAVPLGALAHRVIVAHSTTMLLAPPATVPSDLKFTTELSPEIKVHFLGVSPCPGDENSWFSISGEPIELPDHRMIEAEVKTDTPPEHQLAIAVEKPREAVVLIYIEGSMLASNSNMQEDDKFLLLSRFTLQQPGETVSIRLGVSTADWKVVAENADAQKPAEIDANDYGTIAFEPPQPDLLIGGTKVDVHHHTLDLPYRVIAIDADGKEHVSNNVNVNNTNDDALSSYTFELPPEQIKQVKFQVRAIDKWLEAKDISLSANRKTQPKIHVTEGTGKK